MFFFRLFSSKIHIYVKFSLRMLNFEISSEKPNIGKQKTKRICKIIKWQIQMVRILEIKKKVMRAVKLYNVRCGMKAIIISLNHKRNLLQQKAKCGLYL